MKILAGEIKPFNKYHLDDIKRNYRIQYTKTFTDIKTFTDWSKSITKPLLGNRMLIIIQDTSTFVRNVAKLIDMLQSIESKSRYVDIVLIAGRNIRLTDLILTVDIVYLNRQYKSDFKLTVQNDLPMLSDKGWKELIAHIGYSWESYLLYKDILVAEEASSPADINRIILKRTVKSAPEVLQMILLRKRFCLNNYKKLVQKYSRTWVHDFFEAELQKIMKAKLDYAFKNTTLSKLRNSQELNKYIDVIQKCNVSDVFALQILIPQPLGVSIYTNTPTVEILKGDASEFHEGLLTTSQIKSEVI